MTTTDQAQAAAAARAQAKAHRQTQSRKDRRLAYWLILPAFLLEMLIHIGPMLLGVWIAFLGLTQRTLRNWTEAPFVGLENFKAALDPSTATGQQFFETLGRTAIYVVLVLGLSWIFGMAAAVFLTSEFRGRNLLRTFFLVPYAIPTYVGTIALAFMFNQQSGVINQILVDQLGILDERPFWLIGNLSFPTLIIVSVWSMWPFAFLMLLAALQNVPGEVYEAAAIDGASNWKQFWTITLPMVKSANTVLILIMGLWMFNMFNIPYVLFGPTSPVQATLIAPLIFQNSFQLWDFGLGGAMSFILLLMLLVVSVFYIRMVLPKEDENA